MSKALTYLITNGRWSGVIQGCPPALLSDQNIYLVPVKRLAAEMGGQGEWNSEAKTVTVTLTGKTAKFTLGSAVADISGVKTDLPVPPEMVKGEIYVPADVLAQFLGAKNAPAQGLKNQILVWTRTEKVWQDIPLMLDPGHGGKDPGAIGLTGTREKDTNLRIAAGTSQLLALAGAHPMMTRTADRFVSLRNRILMADTAQVKLFVSIHNNWITDAGVSGIETYYYHTVSGMALSHALQSELVSELGWMYRGVKEANFYVLRRTGMTASLCEVGFLSNAEEEEALKDPVVEYRASTAIYRGIRSFMEGSNGNY